MRITSQTKLNNSPHVPSLAKASLTHTITKGKINLQEAFLASRTGERLNAKSAFPIIITLNSDQGKHNVSQDWELAEQHA